MVDSQRSMGDPLDHGLPRAFLALELVSENTIIFSTKLTLGLPPTGRFVGLVPGKDVELERTHRMWRGKSSIV